MSFKNKGFAWTSGIYKERVESNPRDQRFIKKNQQPFEKNVYGELRSHETKSSISAEVETDAPFEYYRGDKGWALGRIQ